MKKRIKDGVLWFLVAVFVVILFYLFMEKAEENEAGNKKHQPASPEQVEKPR